MLTPAVSSAGPSSSQVPSAVPAVRLAKVKLMAWNRLGLSHCSSKMPYSSYSRGQNSRSSSRHSLQRKGGEEGDFKGEAQQR